MNENNRITDTIQKKITFPGMFLRFAWLSVGFLIVIHLVLIIFIKDEELQSNLTNAALLLDKLLALIALFFAARFTSRENPRFANTWYFWMYGILFSILGDLTYFVIETLLKEPPFPSIADLFYIFFFILIWLGLAKYPGEDYRKGERKFIILDNVIVVLAAGLGFWYILIGPILNINDQSFFSIILALIYPIIDVILLWSVFVFFRSHSSQSANIPILLFGLGTLVAIFSDVLFALQAIQGLAVNGLIMGLGWGMSSIIFAVASLQQIWLLTHQDGLINSQKNKPQFTFIKTWPEYLPYFWLIIAYWILIDSFQTNHNNQFLNLFVGMIFALVILRQILTLIDNESLYQNAKVELNERIQAQVDLKKLNIELDARVEQRTSELQSANNLLKEYNEKINLTLLEKEDLMKETYHRVKNNLQVVSSLINLQSQMVEDPLARSALKDSQIRLNSMALIHEKLHQSESLSVIGFGPYIKSLSVNLFNSYHQADGKINLIVNVDEITGSAKYAVPVGLILNELISNSLKYAFPGNQAGEIGIRLRRESQDKVFLYYYDTGIGLPDGFNLQTSKSLGMRLVYNLARQLNASVEFENHPGVKFCFNFNLDQGKKDLSTPLKESEQGKDKDV